MSGSDKYHISYLRKLGNLEWTVFLVFDHKEEFGYSFGGQVTSELYMMVKLLKITV